MGATLPKEGSVRTLLKEKEVYCRISDRHYAGVFEVRPKETKKKKLGESVQGFSPRHFEYVRKMQLCHTQLSTAAILTLDSEKKNFQIGSTIISMSACLEREEHNGLLRIRPLAKLAFQPQKSRHKLKVINI